MKEMIRFTSIDTSTKQIHTFDSIGRITHTNNMTNYYFKEEAQPKDTVYKILVSDEHVEISRSAQYKSKLFLKKNIVISNNYPTEYGTIKVDTKLCYLNKSSSGCQFEYELYQDGHCVAKFKITLERV